MYMWFVDLEKGVNRVAWKVLKLALREKGIPAAMVISVMSLHEGAMTSQIRF